MSFATSQGPTSTPLRTSDRGAGTRQALCPQASHISSQDASNATESPAMTRSWSPIGSSSRNNRDSASTNAAADRWVTATPFGVPVEPDVKITQASSEGATGAAGHTSRDGSCEPREAMTSPLPTTAATCASSKTRRARSSGSSASTGTYAAPAIRTPMMAT